jgi:hypothetical protein
MPSPFPIRFVVSRGGWAVLLVLVALWLLARRQPEAWALRAEDCDWPLGV